MSLIYFLDLLSSFRYHLSGKLNLAEQNSMTESWTVIKEKNNKMVKKCKQTSMGILNTNDVVHVKS